MGKDWYEGCFNDQRWRLNHLYHIVNKDAQVMRFKMNWAQEELFSRLHSRNTILKARQLGMSTFTSILFLDLCLFNDNFPCGIIDKTLPDAKEKLGKITFAYEHMQQPPVSVYNDHVEDPEDRFNIAMFSMDYAKAVTYDGKAERADFSNGSSIRIGVSLRGGTLKALHISEFAKVAYEDPAKAKEIMRGGFNTVPKNGLIIMESTHEGAKVGENYRILKQAMANDDSKLLPTDFRFFFFPWYRQPEYRIDDGGPLDDHSKDEYFEKLEREHDILLDYGQKRWYISNERVLEEGMLTEFPSVPEEAFMKQVENAIYGSIISRLRADKKIDQDFPVDPYQPLYTSWDIGLKDYMTMWLIQAGSDGKFYILDYYCNKDKSMQDFLRRAQMWEREFGQLITKHLIPHDGNMREVGNHGLQRRHVFDEAQVHYAVVPKTNDKWKGIYAVRDLLKYCVFHKRCSLPQKTDDGREMISGLDALENYRTGGIGAGGALREEPVHDEASHGADSFRLFAEAIEAHLVGKEGARRRESLPEGKVLHREKRLAAKGTPSWW